MANFYEFAATSVDVERAFLFLSTVVSKRWHRLGPLTIQATATLGSYARAGLVKPGILSQLLAREKSARKAAAKVADANKTNKK
jgi:hypothetical protein